MNGEKQTLGLATGLAAAANLLLFVVVAWVLAVGQGLRWQVPLRPVLPLGATDVPKPQVVNLVLSPSPEASSPSPPQEQYVQAPTDQPAAEPSRKETPFISSQNMRAASMESASPDGMAGLITQAGVDRPFLDLRDAEFVDGTKSKPPAKAEELTPPESSPPEPEGANTELTPPVSPPDQPTPATEDPNNRLPVAPATAPSGERPPGEDLPADPPAFVSPSAINSLPLIPARDPAKPSRRIPAQPAKSPPVPKRTRNLSQPPQPDQKYRAGTRKGQLKGTISERGEAALDARATAEGKFAAAIRTAIEKNWRRSMLKMAGFANPGLVEVDFEVDPEGRISNVKLTNPGEANPAMQDCALSAVIEAKLPPPPQELLEELQDALTGGRMRCSFTFLIY